MKRVVESTDVRQQSRLCAPFTIHRWHAPPTPPPALLRLSAMISQYLIAMQ